jgi:hypothetical protein
MNEESCWLPDEARNVMLLQLGDRYGILKDLMSLVMDYCVLNVRVVPLQKDITIKRAMLSTIHGEFVASTITLHFAFENDIPLGRFHLNFILNGYEIECHSTLLGYGDRKIILHNNSVWNFVSRKNMKRHQYMHKPLNIINCLWDDDLKKICEIDIQLPNWVFPTIKLFQNQQVFSEATTTISDATASVL